MTKANAKGMYVVAACEAFPLCQLAVRIEKLLAAPHTGERLVLPLYLHRRCCLRHGSCALRPALLATPRTRAVATVVLLMALEPMLIAQIGG